MPEPKDEPGPHKPPPPPKPGEVPPPILKELMDMREKIGRLEGMMEVLLKLKQLV